jgi:uncharacterized protein with NRDE domain
MKKYDVGMTTGSIMFISSSGKISQMIKNWKRETQRNREQDSMGILQACFLSFRNERQKLYFETWEMAFLMHKHFQTCFS